VRAWLLTAVLQGTIPSMRSPWPVLAFAVACSSPLPPPLAPAPPSRPPAPPAPAPLSLAPLHRIAAGRHHTCAVAATGHVFCWGTEETPYAGKRPSPWQPLMVPGVDDAIEVAAGTTHTCALRRDGTVVCWGGNSWGQLGDGTKGGERPTAAPVVGLSGVARIAAGPSHTCALRESGEVLCWGYRTKPSTMNGQPINTTDGLVTPAPVPGITGAVQVVEDLNQTCAVLRTRELFCWDRDGETPKPVLKKGYGEVTRFFAGQGGTCARHDTGEVVCAGGGYDTASPDEAMNGAAGLTVGYSFQCVLRDDGRVLCRGDNEVGELGDGTHVNREGLVPVSGVSDAIAIVAGERHACALSRSGAVSCWGQNFAGEIGSENRKTIASPLRIDGVTDAVRVAVGDQFACAVRKGGGVACWGSDSFGQLGDGAPDPPDSRLAPGPVAGVEDAVRIVAGDEFACALRNSGAIGCWGRNENHQLGAGLAADQSSSPVAVSGIADAVDVAATSTYACAARKTGAVVCWGGSPDRPHPGWAPPGPGTIQGVRGAMQLSAGWNHACALRTNGSIVCFDLGSRDDVIVADVTGSRPATQISSAGETCSIGRSGDMRCFPPDIGPPPNETIDAHDAKVRATGVRAVSLSASCIIRTSGELACWTREGAPPAPIGVTDAVDVAGGSHSTVCAARKNGEVWCWGDNSSGQCGLDPKTRYTQATEVKGFVVSTQ